MPNARQIPGGYGRTYSERRWFVLGIEGAKTPETCARRIEKAVERLRGGRGQR